jgi:protein-S-isoprenylcysteine O-methyltransferase Ste14
MKGSDKLREKLPDYKGKRIAVFMILAVITLLSSLIFQLISDSISRILTGVPFLQNLAPFTPLLGSLIVIITGFLIVYSFWRNKDKYLKKYGELAYQKGFKLVIIGVPMVISVVIRNFFPTDFIVPHYNQSLSWYLGTPILEIFFGFSTAFLIIRIVLCLFFVGLGMAVVSKALKIFGIDYMGLVYIYYPNESTLQNHEIYSVLRHPTYHTLMLFSIGSIFLRFSIYSLIYFLIFIIGINLHIKFVEEKELIKRFGEQYRNYKKNVPALIVRLIDLKKYFSIIFRKTEPKEIR